MAKQWIRTSCGKLLNIDYIDCIGICDNVIYATKPGDLHIDSGWCIEEFEDEALAKTALRKLYTELT